MKILPLLAVLLTLSSGAWAQTGPGWVYGYTPTPDEWNTAFINKADRVNGALTTPTITTPTITGGTFSSPVINNGTFNSGAITATSLSSNSGLFLIGSDPNGNIRLGNVASATTPYIDFMSSGTSTTGFRMISNANGTLTFLANGSNQMAQFTAAAFSANKQINNGVGTIVFSGSTPQTWLSYAANLSGTSTSTVGLNAIGNASDTVDTSGGGSLAGLTINRQFGGTGTKGSREGLYVQLSGTGPSFNTSQVSSSYITLRVFNDQFKNAGGTALNGSLSIGNSYAFYPQVWLHPGATNHNIISGAEWDIAIEGTKQPLTIGSGHAAGDVVTITFTGSSITGSPLAVTYTVGAGNTPTRMASALVAAVSNNAALIAAGISAQIDDTTSSILNLTWPAQNTVTAVATTSGSGTLTLASAVGGASSKLRIGQSIARKEHDSAQGVQANGDAAFVISDFTNAYRSGQWRAGILIGNTGQFPIAFNGTIIGSVPQNIFSQSGMTSAIAPAVTKYGIDWRLVNFSQSAGASLALPGFSVDGTGAVFIGNAKLSSSSTGLAIDANLGGVATGNATVVAGGGGGSGVDVNNYFVGDLVFDDLGGQHFVTAVNNSTGAVTALNTVVEPSYTGSTPATTRATTGGSGLGLTIGLTWNTANAVSIQPTAGGKLSFNGATPIVKATPTGACAGSTGCQALRDALGNLGLINTGSITN